MINKMKIHLEDSFRVSGDILDCRIYDGSRFFEIINIAKHTGKKCIGLETFNGLGDPTTEDLKRPNHNEIKKGQFNILPHVANNLLSRCNVDTKYYNIFKTNYTDLDELIPDSTFCFVLIDLKQYKSTDAILNFIWDKMSYGGTIFILNYEPNSNHSEHKAINEFVANHADQINISRQMVVDGVLEKFSAIKCYNLNNKPLNYTIPKKKKISVAMVLRTGGDVYNYKYVNNLARGIKNNLTVDHEIVCITDDSTGFSKDIDRVIPFSNNFPSWWGKIELFKPNQFTTDRVFYLDLDTIVVGNIDDISTNISDFSGLRDFYALHSLGSGVMSWNTSKVEHIYQNFLPRSREIITNYREGDQRWIDENLKTIDYLQDMFPNEIVSFKRHCMVNGGITIPNKAKIICFHGNPRPHTVNDPAIKQYWNQ